MYIFNHNFVSEMGLKEIFSFAVCFLIVKYLHREPLGITISQNMSVHLSAVPSSVFLFIFIQ